jgi:thiamine-phosphate pyrophosphorylase
VIPVDPTLYLVLDPVHGPGRVADLLREAVAAGVTAVQVRSPAASTRELHGAALAARHLLDGTGVALVVDDRVDVALAAGADGVHLGQRDLPVEAARRVAGPELSIGLSVTVPEHVEKARGLPAGTVDLLGAGPVFTTATKPDAGEGIGLDGLAELVGLVDGTLPVVAIGGITPDNAAAVRATGVAGLAVSSAITTAPEPAAVVRALRA